MNLPGKAKSGKKKKSTQTINTYRPNNTPTDYSVVIKIVVGVILIGIGYQLYETYVNKPQQQTSQFQIVENSTDTSSTTSNDNVVNVPVTKQDNKSTVVEIPINKSTDNTNQSQVSSSTPLPSASSALDPNSNAGKSNSKSSTDLIINDSGKLPQEISSLNPKPVMVGDNSNLKTAMKAPTDVNSKLINLELSDSHREEKLEQNKLKELIVPSLFSLQIKLEKSARYATGFVVSSNGYALCDFDSLQDALEVEAVFADGKRTQITEIAHLDSVKGLALLKLPVSDSSYTPIPILNNVPPNGENLYLASSDSKTEFNLYASTLLNERKPDELKSILGVIPSGRWVQASFKTSAPNVGGAVVDAAGNLVGMIGFQLTYGHHVSFILSSSDLREFINKAEGKSPIPFTPDTIQKSAQVLSEYRSNIQSSVQNMPYHAYERRFAVDYSNSSFATTTLADVQQVKLIQEDFGLIASNGPLRDFVKNIAVQGLKSADFVFNPDSPVEPQDPVIYLLIYSREGKKLELDNKELRAQILLIVPCLDQNPGYGYAKIYHSDEVSLGDVNIVKTNEGILPRTASEKLKDLFTTVKSLHIRSKRLAEELKSKADTLPNVDLEMINNKNQTFKSDFLDDFLNRKLKGLL